MGSSWANSRTRVRLDWPPVRHRLIRQHRAVRWQSQHTEMNTSEPGERIVRLKADSATVWKPGRTIVSGPPQGSESQWLASAGFVSLELDRGPGIDRVGVEQGKVVQHDSPAMRSLYRLEEAGSGPLPSTATIPAGLSPGLRSPA